MRRLLVFVITLVAAPLVAQQTAHTISPGMNKAQVIAALGEPATLRSVSDFTYIFYHNACGKTCGMNDLVVLHADSVVDAIFRSPDRHYTGVSSSPAAISPAAARKVKPTPAGEPAKAPPAPVARPKTTKPAASKPMKPAPANDTRPSIPTNPPAVRPAPTAKPAPKSP